MSARYLVILTGDRAPAPATVVLEPGERALIGGGWAIELREPPTLCPYCRTPISEAGCPAVDDNGAQMHLVRSPWEG